MATLRTAVADEYRRLVRPPWEIPTVLITNGVLMIALWFLLPPVAHDVLFSLSGPLAFPVILASWLLADTPATNMLGSHPTLALAVLQDQDAYWRWLAARCVVLASLVGVICTIGVIFVGVGHYPWPQIVWACVLVVFLPIGVLPVAAWLGIVLPYRPQSLRWRWQHRRAWRTQLRWIVLVLAPFLYVPLIGMIILLPGVAVALVLRTPGQLLTPGQFGVAAVVSCVTAVVVAVIGLRVARRLLAWRTEHLAGYLADADRG